MSWKNFFLRKTNNHTRKYSIITIATLFALQIFLQSVPIAERIIVNGDAVCTCGCGHTISGCAANHSDRSNCKCLHDKEEEIKIKFASNTINDFVLTSIFFYNIKHLSKNIFNNTNIAPDEIIIDVIAPPPKFDSV